MVKYEDECLHCDTVCIGDGCHNRMVPHCYCDRCGDEEKLYEFDGRQLCKDCVIDLLDEVEVD